MPNEKSVSQTSAEAKARERTLRFFDAVKGREVPDAPLFRGLLVALFAVDRINLNELVDCTLAALGHLPPFRRLFDKMDREGIASLDEELACPKCIRQLDEPLFHQLLRKTVVHRLSFELFLVSLRRALLVGLVDGNEPTPAETRLMVSLACQCFLNEYVFGTTPVEVEAITHLGTRALAEVGDPVSPQAASLVAAVSMYADPSSFALRNALARLVVAEEATVLFDLIQSAVIEPLEEIALAPTIPSIGVGDGLVASRVRAQYEASPYPRWRDVTIGQPAPFATEMTRRFPWITDPPQERPLRVLVAGCGTGAHPIATASAYVDAQVTALDISRRSLSYAARQARRHGIGNIRFVHGDLLGVGRLGESFDLVEVIGVLHHMVDPLEGLRALGAVVKPGGFLRLGLYSQRARAVLRPAADFLKGLGTANEGALRAGRQRLIASGQEDLLAAASCNDFYSLSEVRDLLCHAYELLFTPKDIKRIVDASGLEFLGYRGVRRLQRTHYVERHPEDPYLQDLGRIDSFEAEHPDMFNSLQVFWLRKPFTY